MCHSVDDYLTFCFFFNDTATTEIYTLSLHDALPICRLRRVPHRRGRRPLRRRPGRLRPAHHRGRHRLDGHLRPGQRQRPRSEEHTSELQSRQYLVCRLLLEKKKKTTDYHTTRAMPCT